MSERWVRPELKWEHAIKYSCAFIVLLHIAAAALSEAVIHAWI